MDDSELNQFNQTEDLSITLLERRKRLHVLATEINNWENEANKNPNYQETLSTPPQHNSAPSTSILSFDSFHSPKNLHVATKMNAVNKTTSNSNLRDKENVPDLSLSSPSKRKLTDTPNSASSLTNSEILNVAHRILNKKQSNSAICPKSMRISDRESFSTGSVQSAKSRFENINSVDRKRSDRTDSSSGAMTPKSIIKKFEQMSRDGAGAQSNPINTQTSQTSLKKTSSTKLEQQHGTNTPKQLSSSSIDSSPVPSIYPSLKPVQQEAASANHIYSEHIHPKSIIQKFEQLVKNNGHSGSDAEVDVCIPKSISSNTNFSTQTELNQGSLTYISAVDSEVSPRGFDQNDDEIVDDEYNDEDDSYNESQSDVNEDTYQEDQSDADEFYGEVEAQSVSCKNDENCEDTSLFEETDSTTDTRTDNGETYSLSSSYSGSCINKEFDEIEDETTADITEDLTATDIYLYNEYTDNDQIYADTNYHVSTSTAYSPSEKEFNAQANIELAVNTKTEPEIATRLKSPVVDNQVPLFSIKEYRKQKKNVAAGLPPSSYRRSSVSAAFKTGKDQQSVDKAHSKSSNPSKKSENQNINGANSLEDVNSKRTKYMERIKELEELIKQEDNIIHQTGIALERCLTDTLFTGSSEHIECNRILLISCQKRQAYSSEIGRLKQLINILVNKKPVQQVVAATVDEYAGYSDMSPIDLTGLLIFSDLQLPIKESYLNKLKSGDEKRIFYFLCLIRNGIQVLQTQVISVQELIATRDTSITFPNRMAISNVDVNFKVKIDIYTLEITPKEVKNNKSNSSEFTSKFFSPFKNHLFHLNHESSSASSSSSNTNFNHHYNEQSSLGVSSGGAKTSNFIHIDTIEITNKDLASNRFKLSISSSSIPLTGVLFVTVRCMPSKSIELKGFMTLLEDVNGLRSWDRRWCFLNNYNISYWKYPEDEYKTSPLGIINLTKCVTDKVAILPRDICARKYTFELSVNESDSVEDVRYRLSADTKEQANDWLTNVNYALANLKLWNPQSNKQIKR